MSEQNTGSAAPVETAAPVTEAPAQAGGQPSPEAVATLEAAAANGTPKEQAAAKKMLKKLSFKVDGAEVSEELPFEIPEEHAEWMKKNLSLNKGAQKRMQEKAQLENEVRAFFGELKGSTKSALLKAGIDPKQFAAQILEEELRQSQLTPEQKELEEMRAKMKALEDEKKAKEEEYTKKEFEQATQREYERISSGVESAIKHHGLPQDPGIVKRMANYMIEGNKHGIKLDPMDVAEVVKADLMAELQQYVKILGPDQAEALIGKDVLKQIRQKNVSKATAKTPATAKGSTPEVAAPKKEAKAEKKQTYKDFFKV